jgi:hypothetical protein
LATVTITNCFTQASQDVIVQAGLYYSVCSCTFPVTELPVDITTGGLCYPPVSPSATPTKTPTPTPTPSQTPGCFLSWNIFECVGGTCSGGICACEDPTARTVYTNCSVVDILDPDTELFENTGLTNPFTGDFRYGSSDVYNSSGANVTFVCSPGGPC